MKEEEIKKVVRLDKIINVIKRDETSLPEAHLVVVKEDKKYCPHEHLNIFEHHRVICCKDCGAKLEAFEVVMSFSRKENSTLSQIAWLQYQLKQIEEEKANLEKEITNLKATKRRLK